MTYELANQMAIHFFPLSKTQLIAERHRYYEKSDTAEDPTIKRYWAIKSLACTLALKHKG